MINIKQLADEAALIVNGYAFLICGERYRVVNLNDTDKVSVLSHKGEVLETTMDDIELVIVTDYFKKNRKYMEEEDA